MIFARLRIPDNDDPEIYAAVPIMEWQHSEEGKWLMENAIETPVFRIAADTNTYSQVVVITGKLTEQNEVFYRLKYGYKSTST
jgi:hypothetical protein